jgi:hypothetical protein
MASIRQWKLGSSYRPLGYYGTSERDERDESVESITPQTQQNSLCSICLIAFIAGVVMTAATEALININISTPSQDHGANSKSFVPECKFRHATPITVFS